MNTELSVDGLSFILKYKTDEVRVVIQEGAPWFYAEDICHVLGLNYEFVIARFDKTALDTDMALSDMMEDTAIPVVSPIGVWKLSEVRRSPQGAKVCAWARREANTRFPTADKSDARFHMTLNPDGTLPECPQKYSGRWSEWNDLRHSEEFAAAKAAKRSAARLAGLYMANPQLGSPAPVDRGPQQPTGDIDVFIARITEAAAARSAAATVPNNPKI